MRFVLALTLTLLLQSVAGVRTAQLPTPTGAFSVGRVDYVWKRTLGLTDANGEEHGVTVSLWYPAKKTPSSAQPLEYVRKFSEVQRVVPRAVLEDLFKPAPYEQIERGLPVIHAIDHAPTADGRYPLIVFSHGLGNPVALYTAEIEDLVSHGYVVAAVEHPYDTAFSFVTDDRIVRYARAAWSDASARPGGYVAYVKLRINDVWVPDIQFALDRILALNRREANAPFTGHVDDRKVVAMGHSMGGLASVRACQRDARFVACINQDADIAGSPFLDSPNAPLLQPLLFFTAATSNVFRTAFTHPSDSELAEMHTTRAAYDESVARVQENQERALKSVRGGAYRIVIDIPSFIHRTFSDLPLLEASFEATKAMEASANFRLAQTYTLAFLDNVLYRKRDTAVSSTATPPPGVRVDRFGIQ